MKKQNSYMDTYASYFYNDTGESFQIVYYYKHIKGAIVGEVVIASSVGDAVSKAKITKENDKRLINTDAHIISA